MDSWEDIDEEEIEKSLEALTLKITTEIKLEDEISTKETSLIAYSIERFLHLLANTNF